MAAFPAYPNQGRTVRQYDIAAGQTFRQGAVLILNASGEVEEAAADPTAILGFALHDAGNDPDPTKILVAVARSKSTFIIQGTADPVEADIGVSYGLLADPDDVWILDKAEVTVLSAVVERIYTEFGRNQYEISIAPDNRTFD